MISKPSRWNTGLWISGSMCVLSHVSAVPNEQSCASLHRFGTIFEKCGNVPFARSVANCVNGTRLLTCTGSFTTSDNSAKMLCLRAYFADVEPVKPTDGRSSAYDFHVFPAAKSRRTMLSTVTMVE